jgi:hypothetical protein
MMVMSFSPSSSLVPFCDEEIFLLGLRRSGIHGIVSWLIPNLDGLTRLVNDHDFHAGPDQDPTRNNDPVLLFHTRAGQSTEITYNPDLKPLFDARFHTILDDYFATTPVWLRPFARYVLRKIRKHVRHIPAKLYMQIPYEGTDFRVLPNRSLYVFENISPPEFASEFSRWREEIYAPFLKRLGVSAPSRVRVIQVLREPWNQMASLLKNAPTRPPRVVGPDAFKDIWLEYAREFSGKTSYLEKVGPVTQVNFARWFEDRSYRAHLARELGAAALSDAGLEVVADFGGGSSFDALSNHGKAQGMKVKERWVAFAHEAHMRRLCGDEEVRALSRSIFGADTPEQARG